MAGPLGLSTDESTGNGMDMEEAAVNAAASGLTTGWMPDASLSR